MRFLDAYTPEIAAIAREALAKLRKRLPHAIEMVYDNYNALACGFGPDERVSECRSFRLRCFRNTLIFSFCRGGAA